MYEANGMDGARPGRPRRSVAARTLFVTGVSLAALLVGGLGAAAVVELSNEGQAAPVWRAAAPIATPTATPGPSPTGEPRLDEQAISLSATGDIIMGDAPGRLPPAGGKGFFDGVKQALAADLVMGNLEEPLTDDTGTAKCKATPPADPTPGAPPPKRSGCHQFRAPPSYAAHLRDAGFELLNQANNHGYDYGEAGYRNTQAALRKHGLKHTGAPDEITVITVDGVRVAVLGFSSYRWSNSLIDLGAVTKVVQRASAMADIVVVQVHMGAEGSDRIHVRPGTEIFLGENRGDPVRFSHTAIDSGADLVVGHGPHVMRGMEFYRGRLIAYSLGNFAGGAGTLNNSGRLGWGAVLKVSLRPDGGWVGGQFISTYMDGGGKPVTDPRRRGLDLVRGLCKSDFPKAGARLDADGRIQAPPAAG